MFPRKAQIQIKYFLDRLIAFPLLALSSPIFAIIALAIKLEDRGPIFFRQTRVGLHGTTFEIWKFRSMVVDADRLLSAAGTIGEQNRVTRVGRIIRRTSLDELPQLINMARGEVSLVGPRAVLPAHLERYTSEQARRLEMKPGVTGLAQVKGRNTLKWSKRIEYDNWYIQNYSLLLDLKILIQTVKVVFTSEGMVMDRNVESVDDLASPPDAISYPGKQSP